MLWHSIDTQHPVHSIRYGSRESELKQPFHILVEQYRAHKLKWKKNIDSHVFYISELYFLLDINFLDLKKTSFI